MIRHLFGALLCVILISAAAANAYSDSLKSDFSTTLTIETSYVSPDSPNDLGDLPYPDGLTNTTRGSVIAKIALGCVPRKFYFPPPAEVACEGAGYGLSISQDILRFQQVYRI
jgi:hypothetical protein